MNKIVNSRYLFWYRFFLKKYYAILLLIIIIAIITSLCDLLLPLFLKVIFDYAYRFKDLNLFVQLLIATLIINIFSTLGFHLRVYHLNYVGDNILQTIYRLFYTKTHNVTLGFYTRHTPGDLMYRISEDARQSADFITGPIPHLFNILFSFIFIIIFIKNINVTLMIISLLSIPVFCLQKYFETVQRAEVKTESAEKSSDVYDSLQESFNKMMWIRYLNKPLYHIKSMFTAFSEMLYIDRKEQNIISFFSYLSSNLDHIWDVIFMFITGLFVIESKISLGDFIAITALSSKIKEPLRETVVLFQEIAVDLVSFRRLIEVLDFPEEESSSFGKMKILKREPVNISIENLSFRYEERERDTLSNLNMHIEKNKITAIVGSSGIGKTTIINLLFGFYLPARGRILVNNIELDKYNLENLRSTFGIVSQESVFFYDTILNNLKMGDSEISFKEVKNVCMQLKIHKMIKDMPQGYDTVIQHSSSNLSGGQRQKLSLARALLKKPAFLILDEATSQLDIESEEYIQEIILKLKGTITVLMISHHLTSLRWADTIYVIGEGGFVNEYGNFYELISKKGEFYKLHFMQFQNLQTFLSDFKKEFALSQKYDRTLTLLSIKPQDERDKERFDELSHKLIKEMREIIGETHLITKAGIFEIWILLIQGGRSTLDSLKNYVAKMNKTNNILIEIKHTNNKNIDTSIMDLFNRVNVTIS